MESCIFCGHNNIVRAGKNKRGSQRYICRKCGKYFNENTDPNIGVILNGKKYCSKCKTFKLVSEFQSTNGRLRYCCKKCASKSSKARFRNHNITEFEFVNLIDSQKNMCPICGDKFKSYKHAIIDHNHKNGKNRELLCSKCNTLLGMCNDNIDILNSAINYLLKHN